MSIKITGGEACGRNIQSPRGKTARPTSSKIRQALFNILGSKVNQANFLDLYSGSGIMGIEALSRGAQNLTFIEIDRKLAACIEKSLTDLDYEAEVLMQDVRSALKSLPEDYFDIIFADPPYKSRLAQTTIYKVDKHNLLSEDGVLIIEHPSNTELETENTNLTTITKRKYGQSILTFIKRIEDSND